MLDTPFLHLLTVYSCCCSCLLFYPILWIRCSQRCREIRYRDGASRYHQRGSIENKIEMYVQLLLLLPSMHCYHETSSGSDILSSKNVLLKKVPVKGRIWYMDALLGPTARLLLVQVATYTARTIQH